MRGRGDLQIHLLRRLMMVEPLVILCPDATCEINAGTFQVLLFLRYCLLFKTAGSVVPSILHVHIPSNQMRCSIGFKKSRSRVPVSTWVLQCRCLAVSTSRQLRATRFPDPLHLLPCRGAGFPRCPHHRGPRQPFLP